MRYSGCTAPTPCELDSRAELAHVRLDFDGPALGRKAVSFPGAKRIYLETTFWDSLPYLDGRRAILYHELGHVAGARCEPCADYFSGYKLSQDGTVPRDARRAMRARLDNRSTEQADRALLAGFGYGADDPDPLAGRARKSVEAWRDGIMEPLTVVEVSPGHFLAEPAARAWVKLRAAAAAQGIKVGETSAFRSDSEQQKLYDAFQAYKADPQRAPKANPADPPGYSAHQRGDAVDGNWSTIADREAFAGMAGQYGFTRPVSGEPWHFVYQGAGLAAPPVAVAVGGGATVAVLLALAAVVVLRG